jgi:hypothetical protein
LCLSTPGNEAVLVAACSRRKADASPAAPVAPADDHAAAWPTQRARRNIVDCRPARARR